MCTQLVRESEYFLFFFLMSSYKTLLRYFQVPQIYFDSFEFFAIFRVLQIFRVSQVIFFFKFPESFKNFATNRKEAP